jgi:serine/threonine protein kinase
MQVRYHEAWVQGRKLYVVMEYAPFGDLKYYLDKGRRLNAPFPEESVWRIFLQLCGGLTVLHSSNIVHRDIKVNIPLRGHLLTLACL